MKVLADLKKGAKFMYGGCYFEVSQTKGPESLWLCKFANEEAYCYIATHTLVKSI